MVTIPFTKSLRRKRALFHYLTPCKPAPGIAANLLADPFDQPGRLSTGRRRWLAFAFGATQAFAIGLGVWSAGGQKPVAVPAVVPSEVSMKDKLWTYLGSKSYGQDQLAGKLAAAEQDRLHAQQLRINAEERAENIVASAAQQARNTQKAAVRQAEGIRLDSTLIGAEQIIYGEKGDAVSLKFAARIQCKEGAFGETAVALPADRRISPREVRNLGACFVSEQTPADEPIGEIGEWGVGFFKLE